MGITTKIQVVEDCNTIVKSLGELSSYQSRAIQWILDNTSTDYLLEFKAFLKSLSKNIAYSKLSGMSLLDVCIANKIALPLFFNGYSYRKKVQHIFADFIEIEGGFGFKSRSIPESIKNLFMLYLADKLSADEVDNLRWFLQCYTRFDVFLSERGVFVSENEIAWYNYMSKNESQVISRLLELQNNSSFWSMSFELQLYESWGTPTCSICGVWDIHSELARMPCR